MTAFSPTDLPEWFTKAIASIEERASQMVRTSPDPVRAAGYFQAVEEIKEVIDTERKMAEAERRDRFKKAVNDQSSAA